MSKAVSSHSTPAPSQPPFNLLDCVDELNGLARAATGIALMALGAGHETGELEFATPISEAAYRLHDSLSALSERLHAGREGAGQ